MARLGTKYFTRGKVMIGVSAEGWNRPLIPFDPKVDKVDLLELTKKCEGISQRQADELLKDLTAYFVNNVAELWTELSTFVDLADSRRIRILKEPV